MNTPAILIDKLRVEEAVTTAVEVYKEAQQAINEYEAVKDQAKVFVRAYLAQTGQNREKTAAGAIGLTKPTPTYRVNEEKWQAACRQNPGLAALQTRLKQSFRPVGPAWPAGAMAAVSGQTGSARR